MKMLNMQASIIDLEEVFYPESDGKPMAENTLQYEWITIIKQGLEAVFIQNEDIFIAGDLFWYPVKGSNRIRTAPDVMVAIGRPKGHRRSYLQWKENDLPPQVVFEILSPGNTYSEMRNKLAFYERYGVLEYYIYDPDHKTFSGYTRKDTTGSFVNLNETELQHWTSPFLGVSFHWKDSIELEIRAANGERFLNYTELIELRSTTSVLRLQLDLEKQKVALADQKAEAERHRAEAADQKAEAERHRAKAADQKAEAERHRAKAEKYRAEILAHKLRELGIDPDELAK